MFDSIGWLELVTVGVVALLVYGKNLPQVAREAGKVIGDLKRGLRNLEDDLKHQVDISIEEENRAKAPPVSLVPAPPLSPSEMAATLPTPAAPPPLPLTAPDPGVPPASLGPLHE